ncbi:hypothetical protein Q5752_002202 [Cryptotrichosporon argae]
MSRRLNKRQQRELEALEALKAEEQRAAGTPPVDEAEEKENPATTSGVINPFAALGGDEAEEEEEEEEQSKKKKPKKKKGGATAAGTGEATPSTATPSKATTKDPLEGLDEVDRALAELNMKYGQSSETAGPSRAEVRESSSVLAFRNLLSVDPKNLDADAELRRFFGSKVIASAGPKARISKLRYTLSKPKPNYPPPTSLAGLNMRELPAKDVNEIYGRRGWEQGDRGEKWFDFEHALGWREIQRQFLGAVRSHDPNELMALLQVYPWHVDTLLQMSEVYRLQSDIGAASDYAERALYAFDRCLHPAFNVTSGACRLDFDHVENRPMFTALHRIISYLGRRGCWVTAFNFAKLLLSLDPEGDPHGAAFWLDFLAVKSGNGSWLLAMLEQDHPGVSVWKGYPGMAYARALALRAAGGTKDKVHEKSTQALVEAIQTFPQVVVLLADKIGASVPGDVRAHVLFAVEAGYTDSPDSVLHLLSHIYASRSEPLWKDAALGPWFASSLATAFAAITSPSARTARDAALAAVHTPRDPADEAGGTVVPLRVCRHVLTSESTNFAGFLPPRIARAPVHAYDPLPPSTAVSTYDAAYFSGLQTRRGLRGLGRAQGDAAGAGGPFERFVATVRGFASQDPGQWPDAMRQLFEDMVGRQPGDVERGERAEVLQQLIGMYQRMMADPRLGAGDADDDYEEDEEGMPGAFPGAE